MKKIILASVCILALSAGGALAQSQPAPGASSEGNVGPGATKATKHVKKGMTTGTGAGASKKSMSASPSSEGNVGSGANNNAAKLPEAK